LKKSEEADRILPAFSFNQRLPLYFLCGKDLAGLMQKEKRFGRKHEFI